MHFAHAIITRFNVHINAKTYDLRLSPTWLAERFELFRRFCLPSVRGQTCQVFLWFVLLDKDTPPLFRRMVAALQGYPNFRPVYCGAFESVLPTVRQAVAEAFPDAPWLLTTRLDNDDALARDFVALLHAVVGGLEANGQTPEGELYINFPNGLQYKDGVVYDFYDATNAFVSLLERNRPPHTVFWVDHPSIYGKAPVAQITAKPIFLQTLHGGNVYNYVRGEPLGDASILTDFDLELD